MEETKGMSVKVIKGYVGPNKVTAIVYLQYGGGINHYIIDNKVHAGTVKFTSIDSVDFYTQSQFSKITQHDLK